METTDRRLLARAYETADPTLLAIVRRAIAERADAVVDAFAATLMAEPESAPFLSHELVQTRLRAAIKDWLDALFIPRRGDQMQHLIERQVRIGTLHARIHVPLGAISHATAVLKEQIFRRLIGSDVPRERLADALLLAGRLIDHALGVVNEVYIDNMMSSARQVQTLKLQSLGSSLALQCERLRASLFDWWRTALGLLLGPGPAPQTAEFPHIRHTDFGLWVFHKADLLLAESDEVGEIKRLLERLDGDIEYAVECRRHDRPAMLNEVVRRMDDEVTRAGWLLRQATERSLTAESARDPLTNVFNRRFLAGILQHETEISLRGGGSFAVLMLDLDRFKSVNDTYGHAAGDAVLAQFADLLAGRVRAGDFVFRYGGEEFLVLLSDVTAPQARQVAEKIRSRLADHPFRIDEATAIHVTASIGVALHDGHPDYLRVVSRADEALATAKRQGRDRVVLAEDAVVA
jgi:diguanylate cyclase